MRTPNQYEGLTHDRSSGEKLAKVVKASRGLIHAGKISEPSRRQRMVQVTKERSQTLIVQPIAYFERQESSGHSCQLSKEIHGPTPGHSFPGSKRKNK